MQRYFVVNKNFTDVSNGLINLNDFTKKIDFKVGDKIILQDNNRSYNPNYFNATYFKYVEIVEVDQIVSKKIRLLSIFKPNVSLNIKNGYKGYFEDSINEDFQNFRTVIRSLSSGEFDTIVRHMKYLNIKIDITELLNRDLGPRLSNTIRRICAEKNLQSVGELVENFGLIRKYYGLGVEGHKLLTRKISSLYQLRLENAVQTELNIESVGLDSKVDVEVSLDNLKIYLISNGSARLINRVDEIILTVDKVGLDRVFGVGKIRGLGSKSLRELKKLIEEYNPNVTYANNDIRFPLEIEGYIFEQKPSVSAVIGFFLNNPGLSFYSCRKIAKKLVDLPDLHEVPGIVDLSSCKNEFILYHGFIQLSPISFFIINKFFPRLLDLSKERIRQLFLASNLKRPVLVKYVSDDYSRFFDFDLFGYSKLDDDIVIDTRNIFGLIDYQGIPFVTNKSYEIKHKGTNQRIVFDSEGFRYIEEVFSESVSLNYQVIGIIEGFVGIHQASDVTTTMIAEDLLEYNLVYSPSQINDMCRLKSANLKRRLDKSWVIKNGPYDIDPDFKTYSDWFVSLTEGGKSPIEAIKIVREVYPEYKLRNFVGLIQRKLGKNWKSHNFVMLNSEPFEKDYLNKLRKILNGPDLLQSESVSWPLFWFHYIEKVAVSVVDSKHHLVFKCKDYKSFEDFKTIIESFSWKAKVVYNYDEE